MYYFSALLVTLGFCGLRDYGTGEWTGGDTACAHPHPKAGDIDRNLASSTLVGTGQSHASNGPRDVCGRCGARRVDSQIGLEATPAEYVERMVAVFREVWRVLRPDGTLWCNLGDSFLPNKQLAGIPWRVAFALQADGWTLRSDIVWCLSGGARVYARTQKGDMPTTIKDLVRLDPASVELWNGARWTQVLGWSRSALPRDGALEVCLRSGERIGCTQGHEWPTQRGNVRTDELMVGDVIDSTMLPEPDDPDAPTGLPDEAVGWMAGRYLADGSMSSDTVQIACHADEADALTSRARDFGRAYHGTAVAHRVHGNAATVNLNGPLSAAVIRAYIYGKSAHDKGIQPRAWRRSNRFLRALLDGYLSGDGHYDAANDRWRLGFCRNDRLAGDLRTLAARLGATLTLHATTVAYQDGRLPSYRGELRLNRSGHHNEKSRSEVIAIGRSRARQFWDIGVADEPHTFALASGVLTHNSKPNPMPESVTDRCTKSHEYLFMLAKQSRYYFDQDAIREESEMRPQNRYTNGRGEKDVGYADHRKAPGMTDPNGRNRRSVWTIATQPFAAAHFATMPEALVRPCILAGTSERGECVACGAPWVREVEREAVPKDRQSGRGWLASTEGIVLGRETEPNGGLSRSDYQRSETTGWRPTCSCKGTHCPNCGESWEECVFEDDCPRPRDFTMPTRPQTVLDPFVGSGTTALVARNHGRRAIGIDLSADYLAIAAKRLQQLSLLA